MMTALEVSAKPLSSLDLIVSEEGALCKTRGVIHLHPPCVSINCPGLSLSYCSPSITNLLWVALRSCSFSFLLLFQRGCAIASATLLLTLGHQGNLHPTGICTSSDGFEGNTKKTWSLWGPNKHSWKEQKRSFKYYNLIWQCQNQELKSWLKRP